MVTWWERRARGGYGLAGPRSQQIELPDISTALARLLVKAGADLATEEQP